MDVRLAAPAITAIALVSFALVSCGGDGNRASLTPTYNILSVNLPTPNFSPNIRENTMSPEDAEAAAQEWMHAKGVEWFCPDVESEHANESCTLEVRCDLNQYNEQLHIWLFTCATGIEPLKPGSVLAYEVSVSDDTGFATGI